MKRTLVLICLLLAACTQQVTDPLCPEGEIPRDLGGCCADLNGNNQCDALEEDSVEEVELPPEPVEIPEQTEDPVEEETDIEEVTLPEEPELSITETHVAAFEEQFTSLSYYDESTAYGLLWIWVEPHQTQYITLGKLFLNKDGVIVRSQYDYTADNDRFIIDIEDRYTPVLNYLVYNHDENRVDGCYVKVNRYKIDNCIGDYPNNNPILHYYVSYERPKTPVEWLYEFEGRNPSEIRNDRTYRTPEGNLISVDELEFTNATSTTTLYIHKRFHLPIAVDSTNAKGMTTTYAFEELTVSKFPPPKEGIILDLNYRV